MPPAGAAPAKRPWLVWVGFAVGAALLGDYVAFFARYPSDDAFIFMRIARAWIDTGRPFFNPGERVMGHSSHLWLWLLTAAFRLFGARQGVTEGVSIAALVVAFLLLFLLLRRRWPGHLARALGVAFVIMLLVVAPYSALLMETPVAIAAILATLLALDAESDGWAGFFAGLAFLTRYELGLIAVAGFLAARSRGRFIAGLVPPGLAFFAFTLGFYGTILPHTMIAKRIVYSGGRAGLLSVIHWPLLTAAPLVWLARLLLVGVVAAALVLALRRWRAGPRWPALMLSVSVILFAVYFQQDALIFKWYWPLLLLPLVLGAVGVSDRRWWALPVAALFCVSGAVATPAAMLSAWATRDISRYPVLSEDLRVVQYQAIGAHLKALRPDATLLTSEIGGLGWGFYPNRVIDGAALVSPEALRFHPMRIPEERGDGTWGCIPPALVVEVKPTFIVSLPVFSQALRGAMKSGAVTGYDIVETWPVTPPELQAEYGLPGEVWGNQNIRVYGHPAGGAP